MCVWVCLCVCLGSSHGSCGDIDITPKHILNSNLNLLSHNLFLSNRIVLKFCTEHSNNTAVLCTKFQNNLQGCYGRKRLVKIYVWDGFRNDTLYCNSPRVCIVSTDIRAPSVVMPSNFTVLTSKLLDINTSIFLTTQTIILNNFDSNRSYFLCRCSSNSSFINFCENHIFKIVFIQGGMSKYITYTRFRW